MSVAGKLRTIARMPPRRWADIVLIGALAARIEYLVRFEGLTKAAKCAGVAVALNGMAAPTGSTDDIPISVRERERLDTAWRVLRIRPFNSTCLRTALVGGYVLRAHRPALRVGVGKSNGLVAAHAWIEVDGVSLDPDAAAKYAVLDTLGDRS